MQGLHDGFDALANNKKAIGMPMVEKTSYPWADSVLVSNDMSRASLLLRPVRILRHLFSALLVFICAFSVMSAARADNVDGAWSSVENWPLITVHAAITPDKRVLSYGTQSTGQQTGFFIYDIWDPAAGLTAGHLTLNNMTLTDIFCSSQIILPQTGEILISGGDIWTGTGTTNTGNNKSNIFDYGDNTLAQSANMNRARWYSSSTALVNGEIYIQGGTGGQDRPEVRQTNGAFRLLSGAPTDGYAPLFPRNFLAPDGRVFGYDANANMYFVNATGSGSLVSAGLFSSAYVGWDSGAAMFRPGKILQMGGNTNGVVVIDINGPEPLITPTQSLSSARHWVSATVLANGRVLATGGSTSANQMVGVNNNAEIWNPDTGQWHIGSAGALARLYHSAALLLPDASVLVSGGGAPGPLNNTNAEIYYPPYLYASGGGFATRPQIVSAPDVANVGDNLAVQVDSTISRVTLVKTGSVTHSVNMDQRFLELPFTVSGNMLDVTLPVRASDTPPGYYFMFAIDDSGVPSEAHMLRMNIDSTPNTAVDYTPAIGGGGGNPFQLACNVDEVLVGVHGKYATYVNQIGPQCIQMDQFGQWIGDPVDRPVTGSTSSGTSFSRTCPRDFAVSGFEGRSGQYVNQLNMECRALTASGGLSGAGQLLGAAGGNGGSAQGLLRCGTDNPVYALYGRSGGWLDNFGVQCRTAFITPISVNSDPVIVNPGAQSGTVGIPLSLQINASDGDEDDLTFSATGLPTGLAIDTDTGLITGTPTANGTFNVEVTVTDGSDFDTAAFDWTIALAPPLAVEPMVPPPPQEINTLINYAASASGGINVVYKWDFGDGTPETAYSNSPSIAHTFTNAGIYYITLTVNDDFGVPDIQTFVQAVHLPLTANMPSNSTNIAYEDKLVGNSRIWVVNQDNDSVTVFDAVTNAKLAEIPVDVAPRALAIAPDGRVWVSNKSAGNISVIDPAGLAVVQTIPMPYASQPYGIVFSSVANEAYVVLQASGSVLKLDATSGTQLGSVAVGANPRHVSVNAAGTSLYVSRFITPRQPGEDTAVVESQVGGINTGGEILVVDSASMTVTNTIILRHSDLPDAENQGRGVPNYVGAVAISPDGTSARVPSKQDNIMRGVLRDGPNLNFQNTVRAISSRIDLATNLEDYARRIDYDNASVSSAAIFDPIGVYAFVALETSREVAVIDAYAFVELFRIDVGRAPQGLAISPDGLRLYVNNFMDRTVDIFDLTALQTLGQWSIQALGTLPTVASENLDAQVFLGKQLFYDARDTRLALDRYLSCATCHNDTAGDGRVWDLTGMGEGLRKTIPLTGRGSNHGRRHWSANFDEVQDFEGQIRGLSGGTGLMADVDFFTGTVSQPLGDPKAGLSPDLDALAAYVDSLNEYDLSPHRNGDGSLTAAAVAGREIYRRENCAACHSGVEFTDSNTDALHDIGTIKAASGLRLGGPLTGLDTPTLRGVWVAGPYLHDGSALTLADAVLAHNSVTLVEPELSQLVAYLAQIDANETTAPLPNVPPNVSNPGPQAGLLGGIVNLPIVASDSDGDTLSYSETGLPAGLSIDSATGVISGTLTAPGASAVTVTVDDGIDSVDVSFNWVVTVPNVLPNVTNPGPQANQVGNIVNLQIVASDADGDTLSYSASGLPAGLGIDAGTGVISGTLTAAGSSAVTVTVNDGTDSASVSFNWDVNTVPVVTNPGAQFGQVGNAVNLAIVASDADGDTLSYSETGLPAGLSIDPATGVISGIPTTAGSSAVTVTVNDGTDSVDVSFSWDINTPPNLVNPGEQVDDVGDSVSLQIPADDPDSDPLSFSATGLPEGLVIDTLTGMVTGTPVKAGSNSVTVFVDDGMDSVSVSFVWNINTPPSVTNPGDQSDELGSNVNLAIVASDADDGDNYLENISSGFGGGGKMTMFNESQWLGDLLAAGITEIRAQVKVETSSDSALTLRVGFQALSQRGLQQGYVSLVPVVVQNDGNWYEVVFPITSDDLVPIGSFLTYNDTMSDVGHFRIFHSTNVAWKHFTEIGATMGVDNIAGNVGPIDDFEDGTVQGWKEGPGSLTQPTNVATGGPGGGPDVLTYSATGLPAGLAIDPQTGVISGIPTAGGISAVTVTVNDGTDDVSVSFNWEITVPNTAPAVTNPGAQLDNQGGVVNLPIVAADVDGDILNYSATGLPAGLSIDPLTGVISGTPTTVGNSAVTVTVGDGTDSTSVSFSWDIVVCQDCINLATEPTTSFSNQDADSNFTLLNGGVSIQLANNTWRKSQGAYTITANTMLEFVFESSIEGEIHGIGFDANDSSSPDRIFKVYGTQNWGIGDYDNYPGSGLKQYQIPVGQHYTGTGMHLILVNDDDAGVGSNGTFSNIRVYEASPPPTPPVANHPGDQFSALNSFVSLTVTASDVNGDVLSFSATGLPAGLSIAADGTISGTGTTLGVSSVTVTVDDGNGGIDSTTFNWTIYDPVSSCPDCLNFDVVTTDSYSNQDEHANVAVENNGATLALADNSSRKTVQTFDVTVDTVLEFDFDSTIEGEIHGIGFDENNSHNDDIRVFALYGTQIWSLNNQNFNDYAGGGPIHYSIPVGQFYTGNAMHLVFVNDIDAGPGIGPDSRFSNVRIVTAGDGNLPPSISSPGTQTTDLNDGVNLTVTATDPNLGDSLSFSDGGSLPTGLSISGGGQITGNVTALGIYNVTITVDDGNGGSDTANFSWTVFDSVAGCQDCLDFSVVGTDSYSNQDEYANVSVENGGLDIVLTDNTARKTIQTFDIAPDTVLEFDFESTFEGEIHGIGFDENNDHGDGVRYFALYGTQSWSGNNSDFNNYAGGGPIHYVIPVGLYNTGSDMHLVFVNDIDAGPGIGPNSRFSNVRIVSGGSGNLSPVVVNPGLQTTDQNAPVNLNVAAADPNIGDTLSYGDSGTLPPGLSIDSNGDITGNATTIGTYDVTITVDDGNGGNDSVLFQWQVCDPVGGCSGIFLDFNTLPTTPYSNQDEHANFAVEDGGLTFAVLDNTSRKTVQTFNITPDTVIEFDFESTSEGEIHGIGFDENNSHNDDVRIFAVHGTQTWIKNNHDFNDYTPGGPKHYVIPVGQYYTGGAMHLVFVGDMDAGPGIGPNGRFSNVQIYETN